MGKRKRSMKIITRLDGTLDTVRADDLSDEDASELDRRIAAGTNISADDRLHWVARHINADKPPPCSDKATLNLLLWAQENQKDFWGRWLKMMGDSVEGRADKRQAVLLSTIDNVVRMGHGAIVEATQAIFGDDIEFPDVAAFAQDNEGGEQ